MFEEAGSGKTLLLSSFYGTAQGLRLHQNYLGMKNTGTTPLQTRFRGNRYVFSIKRRGGHVGKSKKP